MAAFAHGGYESATAQLIPPAPSAFWVSHLTSRGWAVEPAAFSDAVLLQTAPAVRSVMAEGRRCYQRFALDSDGLLWLSLQSALTNLDKYVNSFVLHEDQTINAVLVGESQTVTELFA